VSNGAARPTTRCQTRFKYRVIKQPTLESTLSMIVTGLRRRRARLVRCCDRESCWAADNGAREATSLVHAVRAAKSEYRPVSADEIERLPYPARRRLPIVWTR